MLNNVIKLMRSPFQIFTNESFFSRSLIPAFSLLIFIISMQISWAESQELPAVWKNKVIKIANNIQKSQAKLDNNQEYIFSDAFKKNQFAKGIANYRNVLKKVPPSNDPLLVSTQEKLQLLEKTFANAGMGKADTSSVSTVSSSKANTNTSKGVTQSSMPKGTGKQLVSGQKVRVKKLIRDMKAVLASIKTEGPSDLQSAAIVNKFKSTIEKYTNALNRYKDYTSEPLVIEAVQTYKELRSKLSIEFKRAQAQLKQLGNPAELMAAIDAKLQGKKVPKSLIAPFSAEEAQDWYKQINEIKLVSKEVISEVHRIASATNLDLTGGKYGVQRANSMLHWADKAVRDSEVSITNTATQLNHQFKFQDKHELPYFRKLDPKNKKDRANAFLQEGAEARIYARLDRQLALSKSFTAFDKAVGTVSDEKQARVAEIMALRKKYGEDRIKALGTSKLPKAVSSDNEMLAIAKDIVETPSYELGQHGPIVLTTKEIVTREQEVSRDTIKDVDVSLSGNITWSGSRETWNYKWQEFKFATPIKDNNGDWYIWWITAKNYSSGASTTPINKWISGRMTKGSLILEKNF